jgi:hypothetical protein
VEGLFVEQIGIYKSTNTKIIACLPPIVADQLWTWNIISLFKHSAPSLHLSLRVMPWRTFYPRGAAGFIVDGNFIERRILTPFQSRSASSYIYLVLLGGKTFWISNARLCIRTLAHQIQAVGYLVDVYQFPNNKFESIPPDVLCYIVRIGDTILIIIPPEALASEYTSIYYADSDSTSTSSGNSSLHL